MNVPSAMDDGERDVLDDPLSVEHSHDQPNDSLSFRSGLAPSVPDLLPTMMWDFAVIRSLQY